MHIMFHLAIIFAYAAYGFICAFADIKVRDWSFWCMLGCMMVLHLSAYSLGLQGIG